MSFFSSFWSFDILRLTSWYFKNYFRWLALHISEEKCYGVSQEHPNENKFFSHHLSTNQCKNTKSLEKFAQVITHSATEDGFAHSLIKWNFLDPLPHFIFICWSSLSHLYFCVAPPTSLLMQVCGNFSLGPSCSLPISRSDPPPIMQFPLGSPSLHFKFSRPPPLYALKGNSAK